jgi:hypothetical protein
MPPAPYDTGVEALSNAPKTHSQILADGVIRIYAAAGTSPGSGGPSGSFALRERGGSLG